MAHVRLGPADDVARWTEDFLGLEASGWKGSRGSAMACTEASRRFARAVFAGAFARGRLLMLGLDFDGRPIARRCAFTAGEGSFAWKTGFDERFAEFCPGILAERDNLRDFEALRGIEWMDSFTAADNLLFNRLWQDRRTVETLLIGAGARARLLFPALALLRRLRNIAYARPAGRAILGG